MCRIALVTILGLAFVSLLIIGFKSELRTTYNWVNDEDFHWSIEIVDEKTAYERTLKNSLQWEFWELGLLGAAVGVAGAAIGWSLYTVLQTIQEKRIEKQPNDDVNDVLELAERIAKAEQDLADINHFISRWSDTLDKQVSTPVEMLYARDNNSLSPNDESVPSQNKPTPEADLPKNEDENASAEIVGDGNEQCRNSTRSAECSPSASRPDTPFTDPLSWYQETSQQSSVEEPSPRSYEYENPMELTVSVPLCLPVGCGEVGRQTKHIPQYQGNRRNQLRSRGKESPSSPRRKEQPAPGETMPSPIKKQRGRETAPPRKIQYGYI